LKSIEEKHYRAGLFEAAARIKFLDLPANDLQFEYDEFGKPGLILGQGGRWILTYLTQGIDTESRLRQDARLRRC
jgi:hypothetical protein